MGSPENEPNRKVDQTRHPVTLPRPFLLGVHEVTQSQYQAVMENNPSWFQATGEGGDKIAEVDEHLLPVEQVSWFDAIAFCNELSRQEGEEPYYALTEIEREGKTIRRATVSILGGSGFRLPTEAEWEYACRARSQEPYAFGRDGGNGKVSNVKGVTRVINYGDRIIGISLDRTTEVEAYPENAFGLHDMHGNVAEWCWDWYAADYPDAEPGSVPTGPEQGDQRTVRGGSWLLGEASSRSASRHMLAPGEGNYTIGFRIARSW